MTASLQNPESLKHLQEKVKAVGIAMLSTTDHEGRSHARPMHTLDFDEQAALWFYSFNDSQKVSDVTENNSVNLTYACPQKGVYVSITGAAQLIVDQARIQEYWQDRFKAWIPDGPQSPGLQLMKITVQEAEVWDIETNKVVRFVKEMKARMDHERYEGGEHVQYRA